MLLLMGTGVISREGKHSGREVDHSPSPCIEVRIKWSYTSILLICLHGVYGDNFTYLLTYLLTYLVHGAESFLRT